MVFSTFVQGFSGSFDSNFNGWDYYIKNVQSVLDDHDITAEIWISEAGHSTWRHDQKQQVMKFITATSCSAGRLYRYSLYDLDPAFPTIDGFHLDEWLQKNEIITIKSNKHSNGNTVESPVKAPI
ncbi:hypothetical protein J2X69_000180 [Algoriphagus sp. 4150]|uniref:hypothetical protein n=1 Tax=Algoriphagus sp. 4150 TaxID=2817756 RepID=UPI002854F3DB|nr:hypothetical protein [Algoriphagus sp. 4150]MDR7127852.1 hypothetical protein [Algoriphagus sp. 4150]